MSTDLNTAGALPPSMVERMTLIMDLFHGPNEHRSLETVAGLTGLPRSTAHRILDQLARMEWLRHTGRGYALGRRAITLSSSRDVEHGALRAAAAARLNELAQRTGLVVQLGIIGARQVFVVDQTCANRRLEVPTRVGSALPAHCTALGKAILAGRTPEEIDSDFPATLQPRTPHSIREISALHHDLSRVRDRSGVAHEHEECFAGIWATAVAVISRGRPVGALAVMADSRTALNHVAPLLLQAVRATAHSFRSKMNAAHALSDDPSLPLPQPVRASESWLDTTAEHLCPAPTGG